MAVQSPAVDFDAYARRQRIDAAMDTRETAWTAWMSRWHGFLGWVAAVGARPCRVKCEEPQTSRPFLAVQLDETGSRQRLGDVSCGICRSIRTSPQPRRLWQGCVRVRQPSRRRTGSLSLLSLMPCARRPEIRRPDAQGAGGHDTARPEHAATVNFMASKTQNALITTLPLRVFTWGATC